MKKISRFKVFSVIVLFAFVLMILARSIPPVSIVEGRVCDIFGDVVPNAKISLSRLETKTDEMGLFSFEDLKPGLYQVKIEADGYSNYTFDFLAEIGRNHLEIRGDNGLKPNSFYVDFHVFYSPTHGYGEQLFAFIGLYNGTKSKLTVHSIVLLEPNGTKKADIITEEFILEKDKLKKFEVSGLPNPIPQGVYQLELRYSERGEVVHWQFFDTAEYDADWNPH
ncbi:MAG TPA: carboxypeptidase regulatory-like domain-containing protein [Firmicutes bacterium]|nr:carboxypeptidase regulatory-like domain-containing protein [Bacillota bacterium]